MDKLGEAQGSINRQRNILMLREIKEVIDDFIERPHPAKFPTCEKELKKNGDELNIKSWSYIWFSILLFSELIGQKLVDL